MASFNCSTREIAELVRNNTSQDDIYLDVSSTGKYSQFSPFTTYNPGIPVPGQPDKLSKTVEGIWQGLKIIGGNTNFKLFNSERPTKRRNDPYENTRFLLGNEVVGLVEARNKIYVPSYTYMFDNLVPAGLKEEIYEMYRKDKNIYFYDRDDNANINYIYDSYSHSALLVSLFKKYSQQKAA